jgi:basic membrane protein A
VHRRGAPGETTEKPVDRQNSLRPYSQVIRKGSALCKSPADPPAVRKRIITGRDPMTFMQKFLGATAALALTAGAALAEPGLIIDLGGKFDKSFNESAYNGAQKWVEDTGGSYMETELASEAQREQTMRRMAERGANPIVVLGFANASTLEKVAPDYPETRFAIVDMVVDQPNVQSIVFTEHEGSYLVGMLAAMASKTGTISFVGGMDVPLIRKFACGYAQGAKAVNPDITVIENMTGTTPAAWNDPVKGAELTKAQISQGSDVVYAAAGGTGVGVLQAAADEGVYSIGVDSNQNYLHPGSVLTSMLKRVDNAVYTVFNTGAEGELPAGINVLGLENNGVGYAVDENNEALINDEMKAAVEDAKAKIISGEIEVHDYTSDDSCPVM